METLENGWVLNEFGRVECSMEGGRVQYPFQWKNRRNVWESVFGEYKPSTLQKLIEEGEVKWNSDEMENEETDENGVKIFCEYKYGKNDKGEPIAYERIKVEFEVYAETPLISDGGKMLEILNAETYEQIENIGFDLDRYNPIFGS